MTEEIDRLGTLLRGITDRNQAFLRQCSETKFLAISDTTSAVEEYRTLAKSVLNTGTGRIPERSPCQDRLRDARVALESGGMMDSYIEALRSLRNSFLMNILRPAVRTYLENSSEEAHHVEKLYEEQLKIEGLLDTAQFIQKIGSK